jgi:hypothetical protein
MCDLRLEHWLQPTVVQILSMMSNLPPSTASFSSPLHFLQQHPLLLDALLMDCNYDLDEVTQLIEPALTAAARCERTPYYIQAVVIGNTRFLMTNAAPDQTTDITPQPSTWLVGRSPACAITIANRLVSRCHAVIGYHSAYGFYITDLSSSNGTRVNYRRLSPSERYLLQDGDLLQLGGFKLEFFLISQVRQAAAIDETTCY